MSEPPALAVGFCPFCRESFEGVERCPDHDLPLVAWSELPREEVGTEPPATAFNQGRYAVLAAAGLALLGFFLPVVAVDGVSSTGALLAMESAANAWIVPACAFAAVATIARRRTAASLRGARFVIAFFGVVVLASMAWTTRAVVRGAALRGALVEPRVGAYLLALAALAFLLAPGVLGRQRESGR